MPDHRRFPPPWSVEETAPCFIVRDASGQALAFVYCEDEPGRQSTDKLLTGDEARRIAANIAKLPELLKCPVPLRHALHYQMGVEIPAQAYNLRGKVEVMFSRPGLLLFGFGAFSLLALPAAAQQQIGTAHSVTPSAHGSVAGTLASGAGVHADETIGTDKAGVAGLRFQDQSNLDVGPNSSVRLNKFIYDPNRSGGKAVLDATKGSFRFSTGAQGGNRNYQVKTPYGTLGIRG